MNEQQASSKTTDEARNQVIHGFLGVLHEPAEIRTNRVNTAMRAVQAQPSKDSRFWIKATAPLSVAALICLGIFLIAAPPLQQSAEAMVASSIKEIYNGIDRTYTVSVGLVRHSRGDEREVGVLQVRDQNLFALRIRTPENHELVIGQDLEGPWTIRRDGTVEREDPEVAWPGWIASDSGSLPLDSPDAFLLEVTQNYEVSRSEPDANILSSASRISATRREQASPDRAPNQIELWINPDNNLITRMELIWSIERPDENQFGERSIGVHPRGSPHERRGESERRGPPDSHSPRPRRHRLEHRRPKLARIVYQLVESDPQPISSYSPSRSTQAP